MKTKPCILILISVLWLMVAQTLMAQTPNDKLIIKGILSDSVSHQPIAFATVKLSRPNGETIKAAVSREDGSFSFNGLPTTTYQVTIAMIGYAPKKLDIHLQKNTDFGVVLLQPQVNQLKDVAVTGTRPIIRQKADRIIYGLQADPESKSASVLGMVHKIPYLTLDGQDNILLKGNSSFKVLINGKPSPSIESNLNAVLKSMPAASIETIEVITIPPSKYDGEGLAGIINIITVKKVNNGYSGMLNANESFPVGGPGAGGSFTGKSGKLMLSAFGGASINRTPETRFTYDRESLGANATRLLQSGTRQSDQKTAYLGTEMSYEADSLHLLSGQFNLNGSRGTDRLSQTSTLNNGVDLLQAYQLMDQNRANNYGWDAGLNYQLGFKGVKNRLLTFSYQYSGNGNHRNGDVAMSNRLNFTTPDYTQADRQQFNEHTLQADFTTPYKAVTIEAGVKGILRTSRSNFGYSSLDEITGQFIPNANLSNQYTNRQNVFSAYNSYQLNLKSWNINAGLRLEQTLINADFTSTATAANQHYLNLLPSVAVSKSLTPQSSINFGFSQRIRRPGINRLNPYVDRSNPNFEVTGNPNLRPVLLNDVQLSYGGNRKLSVNVGLDYSFMNNLDLQVADFDPTTQITRTSYANTGKSSSLGSNLAMAYPLSKNINLNLNGNCMYLWLQGTANGQPVKNNRLMYSFSLSGSFRSVMDWNLNTDLNVVSRNPTGLQGYTNGFVGTALSLNKELIKNKLGFAVRVNNQLTTYRNNTARTFGPDFTQQYTSRDYFRSVVFSLNYKFGGLNQGVSKSRKGIENNDVAN